MSKKGQPITEELRQAIINSNKTRVLSEETIQKMSESAKLREHKPFAEGMKIRIENKIINGIEVRPCNKCNKDLPLSSFGSNKAARNGSGLNYACKECHNTRRKKYYNDNDEYRKDVIKKRVQDFRNRKIEAIKYLGSKCKHCEISYIENDNESIFDFHHRDSNEKEYDFSGAKSLSLDNLKLELDKCDLLCANCHRKHHQHTPNSRGKNK